MLKTEIEGTEIRVGFYHEQDPGWFVSSDRPIKGFTRCTVKIGTKEDPQGELIGESYCSTLDVFNKEKGRKIALSRAIEALPREKRRVIWEAYFGRFPGIIAPEGWRLISESR